MLAVVLDDSLQCGWHHAFVLAQREKHAVDAEIVVVQRAVAAPQRLPQLSRQFGLPEALGHVLKGREVSTDANRHPHVLQKGCSTANDRLGQVAWPLILRSDPVSRPTSSRMTTLELRMPTTASGSIASTSSFTSSISRSCSQRQAAPVRPRTAESERLKVVDGHDQRLLQPVDVPANGQRNRSHILGIGDPALDHVLEQFGAQHRLAAGCQLPLRENRRRHLCRLPNRRIILIA